MTELEWLKEQSGYTDEELKSFESVMGSAKFVSMLQKIQASVTQAAADKRAAEETAIESDRRYREEFLPEMRKVTQDAVRAQGEAAKMAAQLKQAQEYGIVPEPPAAVEPPRAPGSPDPNALTRDDLNRFSSQQSNTLIALNDLNAEHFRLFGSPLGNTQELVDEVTRQRTLGNKTFSLKQAWETKHNVAAKREEITKAEQQKVIDAAIAADRKVQAEKHGSNPNMRSGVPSRFSNYKASDTGKEPWKASRSINERNRSWRENAVSKIRQATAA